MTEADARILDAVEARARAGTRREREMTRDEGMSVLRCAVAFRDAIPGLTARIAELEAQQAADRSRTSDYLNI